jgi:hypothetical protein
MVLNHDHINIYLHIDPKLGLVSNGIVADKRILPSEFLNISASKVIVEFRKHRRPDLQKKQPPKHTGYDQKFNGFE